jgi:HEAT repeat protein
MLEAAKAIDRPNGIRDSAPIASLIEALASPSAPVRHRSRLALVANGKPAVPALIEALGAPGEALRWECTKALGEIGDPAAAPVLVRALEDENGGVRWLAAEGLIALGREAVVPLLRALEERSDSLWLRQGAHHVLRSLLTKAWGEPLRPVMAALEDIEPGLEVPLAALAALDTVRGRRWGAEP